MKSKPIEKTVMQELKVVGDGCRAKLDLLCEPVVHPCPIAAVRTWLECLSASKKLQQLGLKLVDDFKDIFQPIPHVDMLPNDVLCEIKVKDASRTIKSRSYTTPHKYRDAWKILIQEHLDAGHIRPSNSPHASPAFLVPKSDPTAMPCWVNDYWELNANTILDSHPLPRVEDILNGCAKGKIWSVMDMTNSFFQMKMHLASIHHTAVTTPFGLYEWLVMPMGLQNSPPIHQR
jgi:hypothetical protein